MHIKYVYIQNELKKWKQILLFAEKMKQNALTNYSASSVFGIHSVADRFLVSSCLEQLKCVIFDDLFVHVVLVTLFRVAFFFPVLTLGS